MKLKVRNMPAISTFVLTNNLTELERLAEIVDEFGEAHCLASHDVFQINLALDEVVTNIISYGYDDNKNHEITVIMELTDDVLKITVIDDGKAFNPLDIPSPDFSAVAVDDKEVGGLGIHFVRKVMNHVAYERKDNENFLFMDKEVAVQ